MAYQPRTLKTHNGMRRAILPAYPPSSSSSANEPVPNLLLANVPVSLLSFEQGHCREVNNFSPSFVLSRCRSLDDDDEQRHSSESFMSELYHRFYSNLQRRWHIDLPIIDYNLARLKKLAEQHQFRFTFDDFPLALEFYLQMDVDLFHWKTASFRGASPRPSEGIFDVTLHEPQARYGLQRCQQPNCLCCPSSVVPFDTCRVHTFVNGYQAILNAPATCATSNMIYVLTCPCGQFDYLAYTDRSLANTLIDHRMEGHRVIRKFLTGTSTDDHRSLYEHSARCPTALQLFLDYNPMYWCFVPMVKNSSSAQSSSSSTRPRAPYNYEFTPRQREEQQLFSKQDREMTLNTLDLYQATIVCLLPDCSPTLKKFMESLFITHAECALNEQGHLLEQHTLRSVYSSAPWCQHLIGRPK